MAYAHHHATLGRSMEDGRTVRAHYELVAKRGVVSARAALVGPPLPPALAHVWEWFLELSDARGSTGFGGLVPISHTEIAAWATLSAEAPQPAEVKLIRQLDRVVLTALAPDPKPLTGTKAEPAPMPPMGATHG